MSLRAATGDSGKPGEKKAKPPGPSKQEPKAQKPFNIKEFLPPGVDPAMLPPGEITQLKRLHRETQRLNQLEAEVQKAVSTLIKAARNASQPADLATLRRLAERAADARKRLETATKKFEADLPALIGPPEGTEIPIPERPPENLPPGP